MWRPFWILEVWSTDFYQRSRIPLYSNFEKKVNSFWLLYRNIGSTILNVENLISKSWSGTWNTPIHQFWTQFMLYSFFSLPYCFHHFKCRKYDRKILISDHENLWILILSKIKASLELLAAIWYFERPIAKSWSVTSKTPVFQILEIPKLFSNF